MSPKTRKALTIGGVAVGVLLLLGGVANAADVIPGDDDDDDDDDDDEDDEPIVVELACPAGQVRVNGVCVTPPPPPNPINCNYVGCGPSFNWNNRARFPNERAFGVTLQQQFEYIINPAAGNFSIVSPHSRSIVRQFQRDYNVARTAQTVEPIPSSIATDGLIGNQTIAALIKARTWIETLAIRWPDLVALG